MAATRSHDRAADRLRLSFAGFLPLGLLVDGVGEFTELIEQRLVARGRGVDGLAQQGGDFFKGLSQITP